MGIRQRIAKSLGFELATTVLGSPWADNSQLVTADLAALFGMSENIPINRSRAMQLATVAKGRRVIAGTIGRLPIYARDRNGVKWVNQPALFQQPEASRPLSTTLTWTVDALMFYPCTWWIVRDRDASGWPTKVEWLPQSEAGQDPEGNLITAWSKPVRPNDVIRFDSIDAGLLVDGASTLRRALAIQKAASHAEDNPVPSIDLHNEGEDLKDEQIDTLIARWVKSRQSHGVGYTSKGLKVNAIGQHVEQLLIDGRKALDLELVRHIGIPAWAADVPLDGNTLNYQNRGSRNWELIDLACAPYMQIITDRLGMRDVLPRGSGAFFETDALTQDDLKTRFDAYAIGKNAGFITNEMIAAWEGWATTPTEEKTNDQG